MQKFWAASVADDQWKRTGSHFILWQDLRPEDRRVQDFVHP